MGVRAWSSQSQSRQADSGHGRQCCWRGGGGRCGCNHCEVLGWGPRVCNVLYRGALTGCCGRAGSCECHNVPPSQKLCLLLDERTLEPSEALRPLFHGGVDVEMLVFIDETRDVAETPFREQIPEDLPGRLLDFNLSVLR